MNRILLTLLTLFTFVSCKKDHVPTPGTTSGNTCTIDATTTSYTELNLGLSSNNTLFVEDYSVWKDVKGMTIDFNCDGVADLQVSATSQNQYIDFIHIHQSQFRLIPLNSNVYLLGDTKIDSLYSYNTSDTVGTTIYQNSVQSTTYDTDYSLSQAVSVTYATHFDSTGILYANDPRWTSSSLIGRSSYKVEQSFSQSDANYIYYIYAVTEYDRGIMPNYTFSWVPFKYITSNGQVKMGYLKLKPALHFGFIDVFCAGWAIQR